MGFTDSILRLFQNLLSNRYQRVTINGQTSDWLPILAGVTQGSILGPLLQTSQLSWFHSESHGFTTILTVPQ